MKICVTGHDGNALVLDGRESDCLMPLLLAAGLVDATCGGECSCGTCHVYVGPAWIEKISPAGEQERELLDGLLNSDRNSRLACQIRLGPELEGLTVVVADDS